MNNKKSISAAEIGSLWITYRQKTLIMRMLEYFKKNADDEEAQNILGGLWQQESYYILQIEELLQQQGIVIPVGFTKEDVNLEAPKLFDNGFDIMFVRILKELSMGLYTISMNMSYNDEVTKIYKGLTGITQDIYNLSTQYLLQKGILTPPPKVTMPKSNEVIESINYTSGFNPFREKRGLNDIEIGFLHHGIETNNIGLQLMTGFAQCAQNKEVKKYFLRGKELAKKQIKVMGDILLESDVQFSAASGGTVTDSTIPPFSDKLMMACVYYLNGFGMVGTSFGLFFTLRNDIVAKTALIGKDIFLYGKDGVEIMIKNGWLEEPPQMEN